MRTSRVCCASGWWRRGGELEVRAASREGPAGYKGVERTRAATRRDPTAAGCPGAEPGDDGEFGADTLVNVHQQQCGHKTGGPHLPSPPCTLSCSENHSHDILLHVSSARRIQNGLRFPLRARSLSPLLSPPVCLFYSISQKCRILKDPALQYLLFPPTPNIAISSSNSS